MVDTSLYDSDLRAQREASTPAIITELERINAAMERTNATLERVAEALERLAPRPITLTPEDMSQVKAMAEQMAKSMRERIAQPETLQQHSPVSLTAEQTRYMEEVEKGRTASPVAWSERNNQGE